MRTTPVPAEARSSRFPTPTPDRIGGHPIDRLTQVWASLSTADRVVLLGHADDDLTPADRMRLARVAAAIRRQRASGR